MTSSSRSESINAFFDGFVNANTHLNEFIIQYEKALKSRRDAEEQEDYMTLNSTAALFTNFSIEQYAAKIYTKSIFKLFQHEFKLSLECWYDVVKISPTCVTYKVGLSCDVKSKWCLVTYDESEDIKAKCECAKFETHGYLCKHILHVMTAIKHLREIPTNFILKRWTIDARNISHMQGDSSQNDVVSPMMKWRLAGLSKKLLDQASLSVEIYEEVYETFNKLSLKYDSFVHRDESDTMLSQVGSNLDLHKIPEISIRDPPILRTKGRPKLATRITFGIEKSQNQKKRRTCGSCGGKGHYATTCPNIMEVRFFNLHFLLNICSNKISFFAG
ncbi:Protein FAR1-RELATED SEQUENCE 5 [Platanthera zijinensis]|uniref:Protein FAR1-RELATED SEQUENCE n=1 Tax=Platanthera zijinensis TaxID=2320716 RepID=A0AAP0BFT6_9ASPA